MRACTGEVAMPHHTVPERGWFTSSYSQETGNNCVEVADLSRTAQVAVRDSKDKAGPALLFPADAFTAFVDAVRDGRFDVQPPSHP
jgi:hypothetical protein